MGLAKPGLAAALICLTAASGAQAAYAPKLAIKLDPATPKAPAALTSTITQESGETASKTVRVTFPLGFSPNSSVKVTPCTSAQEQSDSCPAESQIGDAKATAAFGDLTGPVYFKNESGKLGLVVYLRGLGGLIDQKVVGTITFDKGRITTTFDNLPNVQTTSFQLTLQGGDKALSLTPAACGKVTFDASFTSQDGEQATGQATVDIEGCPTTPVVSAVGVSPKAFRVVRRPGDAERAGYGTTLSWTLSEATNGTRVTVEKRIKGRYRRAGSFIASGDQGQNTVKWTGRLRGKALKPGKYRFSLQTTSRAGLQSVAVKAGFTIRR